MSVIIDSLLITQEVKTKITVAEYYQRFINKNVNLMETGDACPFHEGSGDKKLTLDKVHNTFMCWACGAKGDVIDMHRHKMHRDLGLWHRTSPIKITKDEALEDLAHLLGIRTDILSFEEREILADERKVAKTCLMAQANSLARTIQDYIELDYLMSCFISWDVTLAALIYFIESKGGKINEERFAKYRNNEQIAKICYKLR